MLVHGAHSVRSLVAIGGAIADRGRGSGAFDARDAAYSLLLIGIGAPPVVDAVTADGAAVRAAMSPWTEAGGLPNFAPRPGPG